MGEEVRGMRGRIMDSLNTKRQMFKHSYYQRCEEEAVSQFDSLDVIIGNIFPQPLILRSKDQ